MNWDAEIWVPCRLGEPFTLRDLGSEYTAYLYDVKPDWMGGHGDCMCGRHPEGIVTNHNNICCLGAGPRPWTKCWNYEAKICITPPTWIWDYNDDTAYGLDLGEKRNGTRRQLKLSDVRFMEGKALYCFVKKDAEHEPDCRIYLESVPLLDPYFDPIWPLKAETIPDERVWLSELAEAAEKLQEAAQAVTVSFEEAAENMEQILAALSVAEEETTKPEEKNQELETADPVADKLPRTKLRGFPWFYYYTFDVPPAAMGSIDEWKDLPPPPMVLADIERIRKERGSTKK